MLNTLVSFCDRRTPPPPPPPLPLFHAHSRAPIESTKRIEWSTKSKAEKKITHIHTTRNTPGATWEVSHESYVPQELRGREGTRWWRTNKWRRTRGSSAHPGHYHLRNQRDLVRPDRAFRRDTRPVGQRRAWTNTAQSGIRIFSVDGWSRAPGTRFSYSLIPVTARRWDTRLASRGAGWAIGPTAASQLGSPCD